MIQHQSTRTRLTRKAVSRIASLTVAGLIAASLTACGSESVPTCSEFAAMHPDTGLLTGLTSEQENALKASLRSAGYDDGAFNRVVGKGEVLAYCNIYGGVASSNQGQPISNAH